MLLCAVYFVFHAVALQRFKPPQNAEVQLAVYIDDFYGDNGGTTFSLDFWLILRWNDTTVNETREWAYEEFVQREAETVIAESHWVPDIRISNERESDVKLELLHSDGGTITWMRRIVGSYEANMDFWNFPFDNQEFLLKFEPAYTTSSMNITIWNEMNAMKWERFSLFQGRWNMIYQKAPASVAKAFQQRGLLRWIEYKSDIYLPFSMHKVVNSPLTGKTCNNAACDFYSRAEQDQIILRMYVTREESIVWTYFIPVHLLLLIGFCGGFMTDVRDIGTRSSIVLLSTLTFEVADGQIFQNAVPISNSEDCAVWLVAYTNYFKYLLYAGSIGSLSVSLVYNIIGGRCACALNRLIMWTFMMAWCVYDVWKITEVLLQQRHSMEVNSYWTKNNRNDDVYHHTCTTCEFHGRPDSMMYGVSSSALNLFVIGSVALTWTLYFAYLRCNIIILLTTTGRPWKFMCLNAAHTPLDDTELLRLWQHTLLAADNRPMNRVYLQGIHGNVHEVFPTIEAFVDAFWKVMSWMTVEDREKVEEYLTLVVAPSEKAEFSRQDKDYIMQCLARIARRHDGDCSSTCAYESSFSESAALNMDIRFDFNFFKEHYEPMLRSTKTWSNSRQFRKDSVNLLPGIVGGVGFNSRTATRLDIQFKESRTREMSRNLEQSPG